MIQIVGTQVRSWQRLVLVAVALMSALFAGFLIAKGEIVAMVLACVGIIVASAVVFMSTYTVAGFVALVAPLTYTPAFIWGERKWGFFDLAMVRDVLLLLLLFNWFLRRVFTRRTPGVLTEELPFWQMLFVWSFFFTVRTFLPGSDFLESIRLLRYYVLYPLFLTLIVADVVTTEEKARSLLRKILLGAWVIVPMAFLDAFWSVGYNRYNINREIGTGTLFYDPGRFGIDTRAISLLINPNNLAAYLAFCISTVLGFRAKATKRGLLDKRTEVLFTILCTVGIAITFSRGVPLALIIVITYLYLQDRMQGKCNTRFIVAISALVFLALLYIGIATIVRKGSFLAERSAIRRFEVSVWYLQEMITAPWYLVIGLGTDPQTDNMFTRILSHTGLVGLGLFTGVIYQAFKRMSLLRKQLPAPVTPYVNAALYSFLLVTAWGLAAESFRMFPVAFLVWMAVGISFGLGRATK